jgi:divalent metal cation (Fe/Co/Zn/Cd) transporter
VGLLIYYFTSLWWIDSTIAFIFGGIITFSGFKILRHSIAGIMDEADFDLVERIVQELNKYRNENWIDLHHFRIVKYGGFLHIDCHLTLPWFLNVREQEKELKKFTQIINGIYENDIEFSIQVEPCEKISCSICQKDDCPVRQNEFIKKMDWNLKTVLEDKKHAETPI